MYITDIILGITSEGSNYRYELLTGAAIATLVAGIITFINNNKQIKDSLDSKSGWRKELFNVSSKTFVTTDEAYLILSALRYMPHDDWEPDKKTPTDFKEMTSYMYYHLTNIVNCREYNLEELREQDFDSNNKITLNLNKYSLRSWSIVLEKENKNELEPRVLKHNDSEKVRLFAKYLLKHHWEDLGNGYIGRAKYRALEEKKIIEEVYKEIEKLT